jgi:hypothetical protein
MISKATTPKTAHGIHFRLPAGDLSGIGIPNAPRIAPQFPQSKLVSETSFAQLAQNAIKFLYSIIHVMRDYF